MVATYSQRISEIVSYAQDWIDQFDEPFDCTLGMSLNASGFVVVLFMEERNDDENHNDLVDVMMDYCLSDCDGEANIPHALVSPAFWQYAERSEIAVVNLHTYGDPVKADAKYAAIHSAEDTTTLAYAAQFGPATAEIAKAAAAAGIRGRGMSKAMAAADVVIVDGRVVKSPAHE